MVNIPGLPMDGEPIGLRGYLAALFYISIGVAALLAVVKLVIAGARYMLSDVANTKEAAKADIRGAIIGLLIILATYIILNTINTQILEGNIALEPFKIGVIDWPEPGEETYQERLERAIRECQEEGGSFYTFTGGRYVCGTASLDDVILLDIEPADLHDEMLRINEDYEIVDIGHSPRPFPRNDNETLQLDVNRCATQGGIIPFVICTSDTECNVFCTRPRE